MNRIDWHAFIMPPRPVPEVMGRMARLMGKAEERGSIEEFGRFYDQWDVSYFLVHEIADAFDNRRGAK